MTTPTPDPRRPEVLTPEEWALATRLARIGPRGEPPASLDAAIIGAAHAAAGREPPRHGRWPALLGIAATLALAVGLGWQLRPAAEAPVASDERPTGPPSSTATEAAMESDAAASTPPTEPRHTSAPSTAGQRANKSTATPDTQRPMAKSAPQPVPPPVPPSPPPVREELPAPPASPAPVPAPKASEAFDTASMPAQRDAMSRRMEDRSTSAEAGRAQGDSATSAGALAFPAGGADLPVVQDSQLEPEAWIDRIRVRRGAGDIAGARESLRMLRRSHPEVIVPDDLRALIDDGRP